MRQQFYHLGRDYFPGDLLFTHVEHPYSPHSRELMVTTHPFGHEVFAVAAHNLAPTDMFVVKDPQLGREEQSHELVTSSND